MKAKLLVVLGVVAVVVPLVIAQQVGQDRQERQTGIERQQYGTQRQQPGMQAGQEKDIDQRFLKQQIQCNLFEAEAAKLVAQKASDDSVKQFAQKLQEDHQQNVDQLKKIAQAKQMQVPTQMASWQQSILQEMQQTDPETLEREFLFGAVASHHREILANKFAAQKAQDSEVKQFATRNLPTLQQHLQQANRLTQQVTGVQPEAPGVAGR